MSRKSGFDMARFDRIVGQLSGKRRTAVLDRVYKQWGVRYLAWIKGKFIKNSQGGGAWPPLKRKRKRGKLKSARILRDTGTLLKALDIGSPGNLFERLRNGVRVGFGGQSRHPEGDMTIADIAKAHNNGEGHLPKRKILYWPDQRFATSMLNDLRRAISRIGRS